MRENGVEDPYSLKAVFIAGSPGSGKGYITDKLFGLETDVSLALSTRTGLKLADSDPFFVHFLWKDYQIKPEQLGALTDEQFNALTQAFGSPRQKALDLVVKLMESWTRDRLGMIVETTGRSARYIKDLCADFNAAGYDTMMIFLNVSLETALARNRRRGELGGRALPEELVESLWSQGQANLPVYQEMFGENLIVVDNDPESAGTGGITPAIRRAVQAFLDRPVQSRRGQAWIEAQRASKRRPLG